MLKERLCEFVVSYRERCIAADVCQVCVCAIGSASREVVIELLGEPESSRDEALGFSRVYSEKGGSPAGQLFDR